MSGRGQGRPAGIETKVSFGRILDEAFVVFGSLSPADLERDVGILAAVAPEEQDLECRGLATMLLLRRSYYAER